MKKNYKYIFIVAFIILPFLFINSVQAETTYKATVKYVEGAKCNIYYGSLKSSGFCYYANSNLNSYVPGVIWLDAGDEVIVHPDKKVATKDTSLCSGDYVYTDFNFKGNTYHGYYCSTNLNTGNLLTDELKEKFKAEGFPESYWPKLAELKTNHPNWEFKAIKTDLNFKDVVTNQTYGEKSLLRKSMSNNYRYLSLDGDAFDYYRDYYIAYDDTTGSDPWYKANYDAIAYYVDPRNFLSDMYIFQFETLSFDESISDDRLLKSIKGIFGNDYLSRFSNTFLEAGKTSKVNPIYLSSLSKEEVSNGATAGAAISGLYNGMYNFYNIGAYSGSNPVYNGLNFAANADDRTQRPWNTPEKGIIGGAIWIYDNYVYPGQDTSYFKKYNVVYNYLKSIGRKPTYNNYDHQYMQNITAPSSEASTTYRSYSANGMLGLSYTFYIPVYKDMPTTTYLPDSKKGGWPNNYLSSISINGLSIADFDGGVEIYNYNLDINTPQIEITAKPVSGTAKITGTGKFKIDKNTTKEIKVTAENGDIKTYKISITLTGTKLEDPIDVVTTLNNAGIKNSNKYLSGFSVGYKIENIKAKILNANSDAKVVLKNRSGKEKNSGIITTGDSVTITVGEETKTYEIILYGDVNGDGKISSGDYVLIKNSIMGTATLSGVYKEAADVDRNGQPARSGDYVLIKNSIMGTGTIRQ